MKHSHALSQAGVTLTELLVVLVIVSILATIAVPVYINKAENARIATAQLECRMIAEAEEACAMNHGFYVPLQVLDDMPANTSFRTEADAIDQESSSLFLIDPNKPITALDANQQQLNALSLDPRVQRLAKRWEGPFLNPQRVYIGDASTNDPNLLIGELNRQDYPLDPWGQPYRFYAPDPYGIIGTTAITQDPMQWRTATFSDGRVTRVDNLRHFDRFAIVSFGPNGIPNDVAVGILNVQDDIVYYFGRTIPPSQSDSTTSATATATPIPTATP
jgi:prepilin-type N-terminal cleavage/methylation domain-containing protein